MIPIKHMDFSITDSDGKILGKGMKQEIEFAFEKGKTIDLGYHSNPGQQNYIVKCKFVADMGAGMSDRQVTFR